MLCASTLAALEESTPCTQPARTEEEESVVSVLSDASLLLPSPSGTSPSGTSASGTSAPTCAVLSTSTECVGAVRSERAPGTDASYDAAEKWILAALRRLDKDVSDLMLPSHEPNDALVSGVHAIISQWRLSHTTAGVAGVVDHRAHEMTKVPPKCVLAKVRGWFIRHVNRERGRQGIREVDESWARKLAGVKADAREVNSNVRDEKARDGSLYHHKHDLAPTYEQVTAMCAIAFTGDVRIDHSVLSACEAGMSLAIYFPTGARGSELKNMHLQSIGYEEIAHESSGQIFRCLKLTAFECKTKDEHLNQYLASSNPWRCGVGGMGISILLRVKMEGPPPFTMQRDERSWKIVGTSVGKSFERRLNDAFGVAGVRRQSGDPLTYLGRHFGTRTLQHQGGTSEGGAARRGHTSGATFSYSECPLPDLLRLMGNDPDRPFVPAHLQPSLFPSADAVLAILFPQLAEWRAALTKRHGEVDVMGGKSVKVRTEEQLNDKERMLNGIEYACRVALLCLVARPRRWQRWAIMEEMPTLWQGCVSNRVVRTLFGQNGTAIDAMNQLANRVRQHEESELAARRTSPEQAVSNAVVSAVQDLSDRQAVREEEMMRQQRQMFDTLMSRLSPDPPDGDAVAPPLPSFAAAPPSVATQLMAPQAESLVRPLPSARAKRKSEPQHDVAHFTSHPTLRGAFEYARDDLYPMEREQGASWRVRKLVDGREDKSRDRQWRFYRQLALAVGLRMDQGCDLEAALEHVEARRVTFPSLTAFNAALNVEQKGVSQADLIVKKVLGRGERV